MHSLLRDSNIPLLNKRYFIVSDLHLEHREGQEKEFWEAFPEHEGINTCLCAGDLTSIGRSYDLEHFKGLCNQFKKVIYVPGNHEYYGSNPTDVCNRLSSIERALPKLKVLRTGEAYIYEGQRFIGDTMWFPDRPEVHIYRRMINDGFQIKDLFPWAFTQSTLFLHYLKNNIRTDDIIITHHIPNDVDTSCLYKGAQTEAYFLNKNCERYCLNPNSIMPKAWIYGHTHDKHDYVIGNTRFICNPAGYPSEYKIEPYIYEL